MADVTYVVGDDAPSIFGALTNADSTPFDLTDATVRFQMRSTIDRRFAVSSPAVIVGLATAGTVRYDWVAGQLDTAGDYVSHWLVTFLDSSVEHSYPANTITIEPA
jgi:hypothetical protein